MNAETSSSLGAPTKNGLASSFGRHQVGALVATAIDFGTMSALISGFGLFAPLATAIGAALGGVSNFLLGRYWIFSAKDGHAGEQAWRYVLVSGVSLGLNAGGEYILHDRLGIQYLLARVIIAAAVSVGWNFPIQRAFVYRRGGVVPSPASPSQGA
jgi:putative flippase GtrA